VGEFGKSGAAGVTLLDPEERSERGGKQQRELLATAATQPATLFESSWRDFIFAEVWTRPGLDVRSRYLISITTAASADTPREILHGYIRGALAQKALSLVELREVALHFAIYGGWSRGAVIDAAITAVVDEQGMAEPGFAPLRAAAWDPQQRLQDGAAGFKNVMTFGGPPPVTPYFETGILNFVFGEAWEREGLDQRGRRWVTLVGVADSSSDVPIRTHIYAAMASGNASVEEMNEFVLQYAIHSGWPRASVLQGVVLEMAQKINNGLTWDGKALEKNA
jgi:4-carboxymuconolactone decarboxylase